MTLKIYGIKQEESPYDTKPLKVLKSEVELLMGSKKNKLTFTVIESDT
jgi:hypothetical protein